MGWWTSPRAKEMPRAYEDPELEGEARALCGVFLIENLHKVFCNLACSANSFCDLACLANSFCNLICCFALGLGYPPALEGPSHREPPHRPTLRSYTDVSALL